VIAIKKCKNCGHGLSHPFPNFEVLHRGRDTFCKVKDCSCTKPSGVKKMTDNLYCDSMAI